MNKKITSTYLLGIALACVAIPVIVYAFQFGKNGVSQVQENWSHFASFLTAFASIANLIVVYGIALEAHAISEHSQNESKLFQDAYERPLLYLSQRIGTNDKYWYISNIGRGAALNIRIAVEFAHSNLPENKAQFLIKSYALPAHNSTLLIKSEVRAIVRVYLVYEDLRKRQFVSVSNNHETLVEELSNFKTIVFDDNYSFDRNQLDRILSYTPCTPEHFGRQFVCYIYPDSHK
jgi:hypothetical protein